MSVFVPLDTGTRIYTSNYTSSLYKWLNPTPTPPPLESGTRNIRTQYARLELRPIYRKRGLGLYQRAYDQKQFQKRPGMGHRPVHNKPFLPPLSRFTLFQRSSQQRYELLAIRPVCSRRQSDVGVLYGEWTAFDQRHAGDNVRRNRIGWNHLSAVRPVHRQPFVGSRTCGARGIGRHFVAGPRLQPYHFRRSLATQFFKRTNLLFRSRQFYRHDGTSFPRRTRRFETGNDQSEH